MTVYTTSPELDNAIVDPVQWADERNIHEQLRWLRNNRPLTYLRPERFEPFWSVAKHADVKKIEGEGRVFIHDPRPILAPRDLLAFVQQMTGRKHLVRSLVQMDDPDHAKYRSLTQTWFRGENLRRLGPMVDRLATQTVDRLAELGGECDFVKDLAIWYPLRVIMSILGVPEADEPLMLKLTQELFGGTDPDIQRSFEMQDFVQVVHDFEDYFAALTRQRRARPTDDVASLIANAKVDGKPLPDHDANGYYIIIATAGHDTTSSVTAGGMLALLENPRELAKLRANAETMMPSAVNEMIRWVSPVRHFMRTATEDYALRGETIREGESVLLWYPAANRDEEVFDAPYEFRADRSDGAHIAFGFGAHVCLGQHLARLEISALFREMLARTEHMELAGEPRYVQSTFVGGLKSLPIRYRMK